jgi:hypothetical protein
MYVCIGTKVTSYICMYIINWYTKTGCCLLKSGHSCVLDEKGGAVFNFATRGKIGLPGVKLAPRGELCRAKTLCSPIRSSKEKCVHGRG